MPIQLSPHGNQKRNKDLKLRDKVGLLFEHIIYLEKLPTPNQWENYHKSKNTAKSNSTVYKPVFKNAKKIKLENIIKGRLHSQKQFEKHTYKISKISRFKTLKHS